MKTLLTVGVVIIAIPAMTISAVAWCVTGQVGMYFVVCPTPADDVEQPKQRLEKAHLPAPVQHVAKRKRPQHHDEKALPASPPPALPQ